MRELIRRYVAIMFIIGSAIMIFVHLILDFSIARAQQKDMFDSTMHQIVDIIKANEYERARFERELHEDYVIKARAVAYILATSDNPEIYSLDELTKIAKSLEIDEINIFDEKGYVIASCKEENIGYHINENEKSQEFLPLLYSNDEDEITLAETIANVPQESQLLIDEKKQRLYNIVWKI